MKLGIENRKELIAFGVLLVLFIASMWHWLAGTSVNSESASARTAAQSANGKNESSSAKSRVDKKIATEKNQQRVDLTADPTLHTELLRPSEQEEYVTGKRNIFSAEMVAPPIPKPVCNGTKAGCGNGTPVPPPQPTGPPPPPPINLKFYGFASEPGEPKKIFLTDGENVFIASEGDVVDRRYRVLKINPAGVELEDVLNNNRQTIPLTQS